MSIHDRFTKHTERLIAGFALLALGLSAEHYPYRAHGLVLMLGSGMVTFSALGLVLDKPRS